MKHADLPPLPSVNLHNRRACTTIRLYLAVLQDLPPEQVHIVSEHVKTCAGCTAELQLLTRAGEIIQGAVQLIPPTQVDEVVRTAIATHHRTQRRQTVRPFLSPKSARTHHALWWLVQVAAILLLMFLVTIDSLSHPAIPSRAFALPASLSWDGYVLHYSETKTNIKGARYHITCYHDLSTGRMHVETLTSDGTDIVVVGDTQILLGMDLTHHVAQWNANAWSVDDSLFNLTQLRTDLQTNRAFYEGNGRFAGQQVYRIREKNGLVLLLDRHYQPVNVLQEEKGSGKGQPLYEKLALLPVSQVPNTLWDTNVPAGFQVGTLPPGP
jgi:hypothetical protein